MCKLSKYKYKSPVENGYTKFKLTKKQHNKVFKNRKRRWSNSYHYYYNDHGIVIEIFTSWPAVILITALFPVHVFIHGLSKLGQIAEETTELYCEKRTGTFVSAHYRRGHGETYNKAMRIISSK